MLLLAKFAKECKQCEEVKEYHSFPDQTSKICEDCSEEFIECDFCSDIVDKDEVTTFEDETYCETCKDDNLGYCEKCEEYSKNEDLSNIFVSDRFRNPESALWCDSCRDNNSFKCAGCEESFDKDKCDNFSFADSENTYCLKCYENSDHYYCEECNETFENDFSGEWCEDDESVWNCNDCSENNNRVKFIPSVTFNKTNGIKRFFGIELETIKNSDYNQVKHIHFNSGSDGSIGDMDDDETGIEYRSMPLQGDLGIQSIEEFCQALNASKHRVNKTTGFHVHIDCRDLTTSQLMNVLSLARIIDLNLFSLMPKSRRKNTYCQKFDIPKSVLFNSGKDNTTRHLRNLDRYRGTNFQAYYEHKTIEFRFHSGTTNAKKIINWIKLCLSIVEIGKNRFWGKALKVAISASFKNLLRIISILKLDEDTATYWQNRYTLFNDRQLVSVSTGTEESERE